MVMRYFIYSKEDSETQSIPVIFITAMGTAADETKGFELGAVDYIAKPFNRSVVIARVRTHMRLKHKNDLLEKLISIDGLTEIPNRRAFDDIREREWKRCQRSRRPISILMIDVDMFKQYNDNYGHTAGDDCLIRIAEELSSSVQRPGDFVFRYGGEEFAVILTDTDHKGALYMGELFRNALATLAIPHSKSEIASHITISVGTATCIPTPTSSPEMLTESADNMLYEAKKSGRNKVMGRET